MQPEKARDLSGRHAGGQDVLRIWLLGLFRVSVEGRQIEDAAWRLRKARGLIKLLAIAPGHRLHREQVIEALWPDLDLPTATNNLHQLLHFARRTLQPDLPVRQRPHYLRLQQESLMLSALGEIWVDAVAFERIAAEARRTRDPGAYRAALALYAGDLLPDDLYEDWARAHREALQETRRALLWELAELHREGGELASAQALLTDLVRSDPLHEDGQVALMRLHAAQGDAWQAVQQYRRFEEILRRELGTEPAPETQALFREIQAGRLAAPAAAVPGPPVGVKPHARSRRRAARHTPKKPAPKSADTLPAPLTSFVGRDYEIAGLTNHLRAVRLLTLVGPGGSGKTRLALQVAALTADEFDDGVRFVDFSAVADPALVPGTVGTALGVREQARRPLLDTITHHLQPQHLLLVLDNCEHLAEACATLAAHLLQNCPRLRILTTGRQPLHVPGELVWRVPPLSLPSDGQEAMSDVLRHDAIRLFVERGRLALPGFDLTSENVSAIVDVCRRLDGLPLAIELAAARLGVLAVSELRSRLEDRFRLLTEGGVTLPPRQQTLQGAIDWSYGLLTRAEQALFDRLSVFQGGFTLDAAEVVCIEDGLARDDVLDLLAHLIDKSMVVVDEIDDGSVRYRLLDTLLAYGRERLGDAGATHEVEDRHTGYFLELAAAAEAGLNGSDQSRWLARLDGEHENLRLALDRAEQRDARVALRLAGALGRFWEMRGRFGEGRRRLESVLSAASALGDSAERSQALAWAGRLARLQGDHAEAAARSREALAMSRRLRDDAGSGRALENLGVVAWSTGDFAQAREHLEEGLRVFRQIGDRSGLARSLNDLALVADVTGDDTDAVSLYQQALAVFRECGDRHGVALVLMNLGTVAHEQGDKAAACRYYEESIALYREFGDQNRLAAVLHNRGNALKDVGDLESARASYEESLSMHRAAGDPRGTAYVLTGLGNLACDLGDFDQATRLLREAIEIRGTLKEMPELAKSLEALAHLAFAQRQTPRGVRLAGTAAAIRDEIGSPPTPTEQARLQPGLGVALQALGQEPYDALWAEGRALSPEQAIAYAVSPEGAIPVP